MDLNNTLLLVVDYQERLMPVIFQKHLVIQRAARMVDAFNVFGLPILVTEQYPKGLGRTISEIKSRLSTELLVIEKTQFSAYCKEVADLLESHQRKSIVLIGVETHVCVYQSVRDLIKHGYEVTVVADAVSSRFEYDRLVGFEAIRALGAKVLSSEMVIYDLMHDSKHPSFKDILKLVK